MTLHGIKGLQPRSLFVYTAIMDSFNHNYGVFDSKTVHHTPCSNYPEVSAAVEVEEGLQRLGGGD
jgi:hypothetical protein